MEDYRVIRAIGKGSFGKVFLVRYEREKKQYVMKVIRMKDVPKKEKDACRNEVMLMQRLTHPAIVAYKASFFDSKEHLCIVMTFCDGGDLQQRINAAKNTLFKEDQIMNWFVQIALGIHYMHSRKVLHRDIKAQNIFLLGNGRMVLGDLGISKVMDGTMAFASTQIGTPYYMSPELFKNKPYNHKSDVWALGCVLYEMTTLKHAFDGQSLNGLASKIMRGTYTPISSKYSTGLRDLINSMLKKEPGERPSLAQILVTPFLKKHLYNFIKDIVDRSSSIGEGTAMFKDAAVHLASAAGALPAALETSLGQHAKALYDQLRGLGLEGVVAKALTPENPFPLVKPMSPTEARRAVREQANALSREEERNRNIQAALERYRQEREKRAQKRDEVVRGRSDPRRAPLDDKLKAAERRREAQIAAQRGVRPSNAAAGAAERQAAVAARKEEVDRRRHLEMEKLEKEAKRKEEAAAKAREDLIERDRRAAAAAEAERERRKEAERQQRESLKAREREKQEALILERQTRERRERELRAAEREERPRVAGRPEAMSGPETAAVLAAQREALSNHHSVLSRREEEERERRRAHIEVEDAFRSGPPSKALPSIVTPVASGKPPSRQKSVATRTSDTDDSDVASEGAGYSLARAGGPVVRDVFRAPNARVPARQSGSSAVESGCAVDQIRNRGRRSASPKGSGGGGSSSDRELHPRNPSASAAEDRFEHMSARDRVLARKHDERARQEEQRRRELARAAQDAVADRVFAQQKEADQYRGHEAAKASAFGAAKAAAAAAAAADVHGEEKHVAAGIGRLKLPGSRYDVLETPPMDASPYAEGVQYSLGGGGGGGGGGVGGMRSRDRSPSSPRRPPPGAFVLPGDLEAEEPRAIAGFDSDDSDVPDDKVIAPPEDDEELDEMEEQLRAELARSTMRCTDLRAHIEAIKKVFPGQKPGVVGVADEIEEVESEDDGDDARFYEAGAQRGAGAVHVDDDGFGGYADDFEGDDGFGGGGGSGGGGAGEPRDPPPGRLRDRILIARQTLSEALGPATFDNVYRVLKSRAWDADGVQLDTGDDFEELSEYLTPQQMVYADKIQALLQMEAML